MSPVANEFSKSGIVEKRHDLPLFEPVTPKPVLRPVTWLTGGLVRVYEVALKESYLYAADMNFNLRDYFCRKTVGSGRKFFWRYNAKHPFERVLALPSQFRVPVSVRAHNFIDGIFEFRYVFSVTVSVPDRFAVARLLWLEDKNPLTALKDAVNEATRGLLRDMSHAGLHIVDEGCTSSIKEFVARHKLVAATEIEIEDVACQVIHEDRNLTALIRKIAERERECESLSGIPAEDWEKYLESLSPGAALTERARMFDILANVIIATRMPVSSANLRAEIDQIREQMFSRKGANAR
ncbi:MAG: hypothetical protein JOZ02_00695 [Acidobacteria bacterium]|nr:hypothetical protein [Acidobacteriota bacterium]